MDKVKLLQLLDSLELIQLPMHQTVLLLLANIHIWKPRWITEAACVSPTLRTCRVHTIRSSTTSYLQ